MLQLLIHLSIDVSYAVVMLLQGKLADALLVVCSAIVSLIQSGLPAEAAALCLLLLPQGMLLGDM